MQKIDPNALEFLLKLNRDYFLASIDGRQITGTSVLSAAFHGDYRAMDRICLGLRVRGYPQCYVTDALGTPITRDMLLAAPEPSKAPLPTTLQELRRIPAREEQRRLKSEPEFAARAAEIYQKAGRQ